MGYATQYFMAVSERDPAPAGFTRGLLHGIMMPGCMPSLMVGKNMPIYAERNTGRTYKLGYTMGVNAFGTIFFGISLWRLQKLKQDLQRRA